MARTGNSGKATTVAAYLRALPAAQRAALKKLRGTIRAVVPDAEDCISYQIPAFRHNGRVLVWYAAASKHCSLFPGAYPIAQCKTELAKFNTSKGTVRFTPDRPLPESLVRKLVKARVGEIEGKRLR